MPQKGYKKTEEEKQKDREVAIKARHGDNVKYITETHPEIAKEWHPTKNGELKPDHFTRGSDKLVWWLCPKTCKEGCPHAYPATIGNRTGGSGCPYCSRTTGKVCCVHDSVVTTHPEIAKEWHPTKNGDLKPEEVSHGSKKNVWWLCSKTCPEGCLHEYPATPNNRCGVNKQNCSFCCNQQICIHLSIEYTHPAIAKEWHPTKNGDKTPSQFSKGNTSPNIWWMCSNNHEYPALIKNRANGSGCPTCKHKTERMLIEYLRKIIPDITSGDRTICPGRPFDVVSHLRKLIFELDGPHHFVHIPLWKNDVDTNQDIDVHKMKVAIAKGYRVIRILQEDVIKHGEAWLDEHLKPLIEMGESIEYICPYNEHIYDNHRVKMEN